MGRLSSADVAATRAISERLARLSFDERADDTLQAALGDIRQLTRARAAVLYSLEPVGNGLRSAHASSAGLRNFKPVLDDYLADKTVGWSGYNPLAPEPSQRNKVLEWAPSPVPRTPVERDAYPRIGLGGWGTTRVLVCDGPQMLAYVALFDPSPSEERARQILRRLVRPIQKRMYLEHVTRRDVPLASALQVVLEELGVAAAIVDSRARIHHANAAARADLSRDPRAFRERVLAGLRPSPSPSAFRLVPIDGRGTAPTFLALDTPSSDVVHARVVRNARRLQVSERQLQVAVLVAGGCTNRAIAVRLRIAERTVESHVTVLLEKADVASRSALVSILLA